MKAGEVSERFLGRYVAVRTTDDTPKNPDVYFGKLTDISSEDGGCIVLNPGIPPEEAIALYKLIKKIAISAQKTNEGLEGIVDRYGREIPVSLRDIASIERGFILH